MEFSTLIQVLDSGVRLGIPLLLACLAGLYSERSGVFDIGLEGKMLMGAFAAGAVASITGSAWLGLAAAIGGSLALAAIHGLASITFRGNQLISGVAINFLASGLTVLIGQNLFHLGGRTPPIKGAARFESITLPGADALRDVPVIGPVYYDLISGHTILVYIAFAIVPLTWFLLFRTRFGLRLRAVGENPESVDTAGVSVLRLRYTAVAMAGILCGIAGAYLATSAPSAGFGKEMTAGKGFIALAALIFANWRPWRALGATMLFGVLEAVAIRFQNIDVGLFVVPVQFMQALPYILTVVILAGFIGKATPPRAGGQAYVKER
ncbi:MAG: ABC transporter permease [Phaeovulum sp.]|uniref:ABC transporter permease n=1 Tax=Phaeovulum sp. TaxID=2934796 RepID=UPI002731E30F|nr:ABC transporter permease [Phaeovulum sp.]MDP2064124.1 ABC transporter permease [Phaeovulum sp.]